MIVLISHIQELSSRIHLSDINLNSFLQGIETAISNRMKMKHEYSMKDKYREAFTNVEVTFNSDKTKAQKYQTILAAL